MARHDLHARASALRWLLLDVDGVLTDGRLWFGPAGEALKSFHVRDGLAIKLAQSAGIRVGVLSARTSEIVERRGRELGLDAIVQGVEDKAAAFAVFLAEHTVAAVEVAYVGDDLLDLPVLLRCGLSFAPADAAPEVRSRVDFTLSAAGGGGAVREAVESLLSWRRDWTDVVASFLPAAE